MTLSIRIPRINITAECCNVKLSVFMLSAVVCVCGGGCCAEFRYGEFCNAHCRGTYRMTLAALVISFVEILNNEPS